MEWFRMYSEFASDPKVQSMSEAMQRRLMMLFCLRSSNTLVTLQDDEIAFALRISDDELSDTKALFIRKGFVNEAWEIANWDKRQFVSDSSAARVARHRAAKKKEVEQVSNVTVTPQIQNRTDTEQIQNREEKPAGKPLEVIYPDEFEQAWEAYPRRPGASKKDSYKAWNARLKGGVSPNVMIAGVQRYAAYVVATQTQEQFVKQPATFFGTGEHYLADWRPSPRASPNGYESAKDRERRETIEGLTGKRNERSEPTIIDIN